MDGRALHIAQLSLKRKPRHTAAPPLPLAYHTIPIPITGAAPERGSPASSASAHEAYVPSPDRIDVAGREGVGVYVGVGFAAGVGSGVCAGVGERVGIGAALAARGRPPALALRRFHCTRSATAYTAGPQSHLRRQAVTRQVSRARRRSNSLTTKMMPSTNTMVNTVAAACEPGGRPRKRSPVTSVGSSKAK